MGAAAKTNVPFTYKRHEPERTLAYQTFARSLESWLAERDADAEKRRLPEFVLKNMRGFMQCGVVAYGLLYVSCPGCPGSDLIVGLSCKRRGFCPRCGGKRQAEVTAHLIDNILPQAAYRQFVVTFPYQLRYWMAMNSKLNNKIHKLVAGQIMNYYERCAERRGIASPKAGGATFMQRFGSALNLNQHYHIVAIEGVFSVEDETPRYFQLPGPTDDEVAALVQAIADQCLALLRRLKYLPPEGEDCVEDTLKPVAIDPKFAESEQFLAATAASNALHIAFGPRAGEAVRRIGKTFGFYGDHPEIKGKRCAAVHGFSVHANRYIGAQERDKLEQLISYTTRPPFSHKRLSLKDPDNRDGDLVYELKSPWRDGTEAIQLSHAEFFEKLAALVPPPYSHTNRYFGVLSSHSEWRSRIIIKPGIKKGFVAVGDGSPERMNWGRLLKRTFKIDVTACPGCKRRIYPDHLEVIATQPEIRLVLLMLNLPPDPPPIRPPGNLPMDEDDESFFNQDITYEDEA